LRRLAQQSLVRGAGALVARGRLERPVTHHLETPRRSSVSAMKLEVQQMSAYFRASKALKNVSMSVLEKSVLAIIGPSGCGKSTFLRCLNRMHELSPGAHVDGRVKLDGRDLYGQQVDPVLLRRQVGMVFQRPNPFPSMSIFDNVAAGLKLNG